MKIHLQQFWLCAHHHFLQSLFHTYLLHHQSPPMPPVQIRIQDNPRHLNIEQIKHIHGQFGMIEIIVGLIKWQSDQSTYKRIQP